MSRRVVIDQEAAIEFVSWLETLFFVNDDGEPAVSIDFMDGLRRYTKQFGARPRKVSFWFTRRCKLKGKSKSRGKDDWKDLIGFWNWDGESISFHPYSPIDDHRCSVGVMTLKSKEKQLGRDMICESRLWYWSGCFPTFDFGRLCIGQKVKVIDDGTKGGR